MRTSKAQRRTFSALRNLLGTRQRPAPAQKPRYRWRPQLLALEQRLAPAATASLNQWGDLAPAAWQNGNLNAQQAKLFEGDDVAYQDLFTGLSTGTSNNYVFGIQWQTTKAGVHALDYLTTYDYTWHGGSNSGISVDSHELDGVNTTTWTTAQKTTPSTFAIPLDPNLNKNGASGTNTLFPADNTMINGHTQLGGQLFVMYGGTITGVGSYQKYDLAGDTYQTFQIKFTASVPNPVLLWGGHIASRLDWGPQNGAASISGSPYHMFQESLKLNGVTQSGVGAQDRSLKTGVVVLPTIVVVNKVANPAAPNQSFTFTPTSNIFFAPGQPTNFVNSFSLSGSDQFLVPPYVLPPNGPTNVTTLETTTFNNTALTQITENVPSGWTLTGIQFFSQLGLTGNSSSGNTAILNCNGDDTVWVTFTDQLSATQLVTQASPTGTITLPGDGSKVTLHDTATLTGGSNPQGTITFYLFPPSVTPNTNGTGSIYTTSVPVNGDNTYDSASYTLPTNTTVTGTYAWAAKYTPAPGDIDFPSSDNGSEAAEQVTVNPTRPTLVTTAGSTVTLGDGHNLTDTADLEGGYFPTGSITFNLYFDSNTTPIYTHTVTGVSGNGQYTDPGYLPTVAGQYHWSATYNGDGNNTTANDPGTSAAEGEAVIAPSLAITKTGDPAPVNSTDPVHFVITLTNSGPGAAFNVVLSDPLPDSAHLTWVVQSGDPGTISNGTLTDNVGTLASGASVTIHVSAVTPSGYAATLPNTATVTASNNNTVQASATDIVLAPNLSVIKTPDSANPLNSTDAVGFTITVSNSAAAGTGVAYGVVLSDLLPAPAGVSWNSTTLVSQTGGVNAPTPTLSNNSLSDAIGNMAAGATVIFHVSGTTAPGFSGTLNNTATATPTNGSPASGSASETVLAPSLSVVKTPDSASPLNSTDAVGFTITVSNAAGAGTAYGVVLNDLLPAPAGVAWTSATLVSESSGVNAQNPPTLGSNTLSDAIGNLAAGASVVFHVGGTTAPGFSGTLNNTATATPTNGSPASGSGSETVLAPNLSITKTADSATVYSPNPVGFTITVSNAGAGAAYNVNLSDPLPVITGVTWTAVATTSNPAGAPSATLSNNNLTDALGTVISGETVTFHVTGTTIAGTGGFLNNTATITSTNNVPGTLTASASIHIIASPMLITTASPAITLGTTAPTITDTITMSNGSSPTGSINVTLQFGTTTVYTTSFPAANATYTASYTLPTTGTVTGTYTWSASYAGDINNNPANDEGGAQEQTVVSPANPNVVTTPTPTIVTLPGSGSQPVLKDSAALSGGYFPVGSIEFRLIAPNGTTVDDETVAVNGNGTYTTPVGYTLPATGSVTGTYQWNAYYTDSLNPINNSPASDVGSSYEQVAVSPASPHVVTTPTPTIVTLPGNGSQPLLKDSAALSGGYFPVGSIEFKLIAPNGTTVDDETVAVNGNGTYTTPVGYTLPATGSVTGTYQWNAYYTDSLNPINNSPASDVGSSYEQVPVQPAAPKVVTTPTPTSAVAGSATLKDSAALSGGYFPVGSIEFKLIAPNGTTVDDETVVVHGNGTYTTPVGYVLPATAAAGTYQWNAFYTDSLNPANNSSASDVGSASEQVKVTVPAQVAPTNTTAAQFAGGTSATLPALFYSDDGTGHVSSNVNPGVFFYFSFASAPTLTGSQTATIKVKEVTPTGYNFPFLISSLTQVSLYNSTGTAIVASGTSQGSGNVTFTVNASMESSNGGNTFIVSVKYNAKSIVGDPTPASLGLSTTETYNWQTLVNSTVQATAGVPLKLSGTQLAPSAGQGMGVSNLTDQQLAPVVDEAISLWSQAGLSGTQLSTLRATPIHIATFLDAPRLGVESDGEVWLNANAAGWGWFTDANPATTPAAGRMDLLTVVEHEFGHVLFGVQDGPGLMQATLAPGVRILPGSEPMTPIATPATPAGLASPVFQPAMADHIVALGNHGPALVPATETSGRTADAMLTLAQWANTAAALTPSQQPRTLPTAWTPALEPVPLASVRAGTPTPSAVLLQQWLQDPAVANALALAQLTWESGSFNGGLNNSPRQIQERNGSVPDTSLLDDLSAVPATRDAVRVSDAAFAGLSGDQHGLLDITPTSTGLSVAAVLIGAGYMLRADGREDDRPQVARNQV